MNATKLFLVTDESKLCCVCKTIKPVSEFYKDKTRRTGVATSCKTCGRSRQIAWRKSNPHQYDSVRRNRVLKREYGITIEDYNKMFAEQKGKCLICDTHQSEVSRAFPVDHCHETGKVRGLLCHSCNGGLGLAKDSISILRGMIAYLERSK